MLKALLYTPKGARGDDGRMGSPTSTLRGCSQAYPSIPPKAHLEEHGGTATGGNTN